MRRFYFTCCLIWVFTLSNAQEVQQKLPQKTRILFLLDGSGSMLAKWGDVNRITAAKDLLTTIVDSLKNNQNLELALRVYGHRYPRGSQNCQDSRLEVGFSSNNHQQIIKKLAEIKPKGTTPIAYSLEQSANDFPNKTGYRNIIIIITDGIESCDGDPCAVSLALQKKGIFLKPFIIGLGMDLKYKEQFDCIGQFYEGNDIRSFRQALDKAINTSLAKTTASVLLLDQNQQPRETNINISFVNNFTQVPTFDFVHYLDNNGRPDSVEIDPVLTYDVVANTLPPVVKKNVNLRPGQHNVITLSTPQGTLKIKLPGASSYNNGVAALIKDQKGTFVHTQSVNTEQRYIAGRYDVEVLTLPRRTFNNVKITPDKTYNLSLPDPGLLNIYNNAPGYGSLYELMDDGTQQWVYNLKHEESRQTLTLQPGNYKIVFRVDKAPGSKYTTIKYVTIESGKSVVSRIFE